jgi:hypothetical protein
MPTTADDAMIHPLHGDSAARRRPDNALDHVLASGTALEQRFDVAEAPEASTQATSHCGRQMAARPEGGQYRTENTRISGIWWINMLRHKFRHGGGSTDRRQSMAKDAVAKVFLPN